MRSTMFRTALAGLFVGLTSACAQDSSTQLEIGLQLSALHTDDDQVYDYNVTVLERPAPYRGIRVTDLNQNGMVYGDLDWPADESALSAIWKPDGTHTELSVSWPGGRCPPTTPPPENWNRRGVCLAANAGGIDDAGDTAVGSISQNIVVTIGEGDSERQEVRDLLFPAVWENGAQSFLPFEPHGDSHIVNTVARFVNNSGLIVGVEQHEVYDASVRAVGQRNSIVAWESGVKRIVALDDISPMAMNESGMIVAQAASPGVSAPVVLSAQAPGVRALSPGPGRTQAWATDINDAGDVLGTASGPGQFGGVIWETGSDVPTTMFAMTQVHGINNARQVVGSIRAPSFPHKHAALWTQDQLLNLNDLVEGETDLIFIRALEINDRGWIAAQATTPLPSPQEASVLMKPCGVHVTRLAQSDPRWGREPYAQGPHTCSAGPESSPHFLGGCVGVEEQDLPEEFVVA